MHSALQHHAATILACIYHWTISAATAHASHGGESELITTHVVEGYWTTCQSKVGMSSLQAYNGALKVYI